MPEYSEGTTTVSGTRAVMAFGAAVGSLVAWMAIAIVIVIVVVVFNFDGGSDVDDLFSMIYMSGFVGGLLAAVGSFLYVITRPFERHRAAANLAIVLLSIAVGALIGAAALCWPGSVSSKALVEFAHVMLPAAIFTCAALGLAIGVIVVMVRRGSGASSSLAEHA